MDGLSCLKTLASRLARGMKLEEAKPSLQVEKLKEGLRRAGLLHLPYGVLADPGCVQHTPARDTVVLLLRRDTLRSAQHLQQPVVRELRAKSIDVLMAHSVPCPGDRDV